jgi:arylsulfatase A-like enzyme
VGGSRRQGQGAFLLTVGLLFGVAPALAERLRVETHLLDSLRARSASCRIGNEIRPALDCPVSHRVVVTDFSVSDNGLLRASIETPDALGAGRWILVADVGHDGGPGEQGPERPHVVQRIVSAGEKSVDLRTALPKPWRGLSLEIEAHGYALPPRVREVVTELQVPDSASLVFGWGLAAPSRAPARMQLRVRTSVREQILAEAHLEPGPEGRLGWASHRVDLSAYAGETVEVVYRAWAVTDPTAGSESFAFPVWADPQILVPASDDPWNLVVVSFDTLRADVLGAYGNERGASPVLDSLAAEGALLEQARAPFPATWASHLSLMTGVYPSAHGVVQPRGSRLPASLPTLAERLAQAGYRTAAVTENGHLLPESGFARGISDYVEFTGEIRGAPPGRADQTFGRAAQWIENHRDEVFFLFVHTYQVHWPYDPPSQHDVFAPVSERGREFPLTTEILMEEEARREFAGAAKLAYLGELRFADDEFAQLLSALDASSLRDRTILVVTSDHGEAFDEHGSLFHSTLYDEVLRVPFLVRAPGMVPAGLRLGGATSLVDLVPTALDLLGLPPPQGLQGENLGPALRGRERLDRDRVVFAENRANPGKVPAAAVLRGMRKWIETNEARGPVQVYDVEGDPAEKKDLGDPETVVEGASLLKTFREESRALRRRLGKAPEDTTAVVISRDRQERLRALGYLD